MIILARHGRTVFNEAGRYQGACDSPLTELGAEQARQMGRLIATLVDGPVTLWSSPLGRAVASAEIIRTAAALDCGITLDVRLREVSLGSWDGLTDEDIDAASPGVREGSTRFDWFFRAPDGEGFENAERRVGAWLGEVRGLPGCHVAVCHGLIGRILRGVYCRLPRPKTVKLDAPQDAVFRLIAGSCERIKAPALTGSQLRRPSPDR